MTRHAVTEHSRVWDLLVEHFDGSHEKARAWMRSPNLLLGNIAPKDLIVLRPGKVEDFVRARLSENKR
jgi:uncharacterized protein (DUF2384 family)